MALKTDIRIDEILRQLDSGDKVADIGCDHGKIANLAVKISGNAAYATDISVASLSKAKRLAEELLQADKVICKAGDGLKPIEDSDADTIVIAGMGGHEIIKILSDASKRYRKYILVPHQHATELRYYLLSNGYGINKDYIIKSDDKFYPIIVVSCGGKDKYTDFQLLYGLENNQAQAEYVSKRIETLKTLMAKARGDRLAEIKNELEITESYEN